MPPEPWIKSHLLLEMTSWISSFWVISKFAKKSYKITEDKFVTSNNLLSTKFLSFSNGSIFPTQELHFEKITATITRRQRHKLAPPVRYKIVMCDLFLKISLLKLVPEEKSTRKSMKNVDCVFEAFKKSKPIELVRNWSNNNTNGSIGFFANIMKFSVFLLRNQSSHWWDEFQFYSVFLTPDGAPTIFCSVFSKYFWKERVCIASWLFEYFSAHALIYQACLILLYKNQLYDALLSIDGFCKKHKIRRYR